MWHQPSPSEASASSDMYSTLRAAHQPHFQYLQRKLNPFGTQLTKKHTNTDLFSHFFQKEKSRFISEKVGELNKY